MKDGSTPPKEKKESSSSGKSSSSSSSSRRGGHADHVIVRNLFALSILRRLSLLVFLSVLCAILAVFSAFQVLKVKTPPQYIQLTQDGRIFPVAPLNKPNVSDGEVMKFAAETVKWVNTYDYQNWKDQLQSSAERFTPQGWNNYVDELVASDNLNSVTAKNMVVNTTFLGDAQIVKQGVVEEKNQYVWMVEIPVSVNYIAPPTGSGGTQVSRQEGVVRLYVVRVPLEINLRGYAVHIYQFDTSKKPK